VTLRLAQVVLAIGVLGLVGLIHYGRALWYPAYRTVAGARTVDQVVLEHGRSARGRLRPYFESSGVPYPPEAVTLMAFKEEKRLELWGLHGGRWTLIRDYPIRAASGVAGPKLREGDRQVPEGLYRIIGLNPNSSYHLSMKLDYPNAFDLRHARAEGRTQPGSDIFIHGRAVSIGCLAMGDPAIEELFVLVNDVGRDKTDVLIAPHDPRTRPLLPVPAPLPDWTDALYASIQDHFDRVASVP
jgi:hypothetical protein